MGQYMFPRSLIILYQPRNGRQIRIGMGITSDDKTGWVNEVSLRAEKNETKKYLSKILDVLSPEAGLSEKEIQELFAYLKNKEDSVYIELNANCYLSLYLSEENVVLMHIRSR